MVGQLLGHVGIVRARQVVEDGQNADPPTIGQQDGRGGVEAVIGLAERQRIGAAPMLLGHVLDPEDLGGLRGELGERNGA